MKRIDNTGLVLEATLIVLPGNEREIRSPSLLNRPPPQFLFQLGSLDIHLALHCILLPEKQGASLFSSFVRLEFRRKFL